MGEIPDVTDRSADTNLADGAAGLSINDDGGAVEDVPDIDDIPDMDDEEAGLSGGVVEIEDPAALKFDNIKCVAALSCLRITEY
jgi:hypothetical protein